MEKRFNRITALFLCVILLIGMVPFSVAEAVEDDSTNAYEITDIDNEGEENNIELSIQYNNEIITSIDIHKDERKQLKAVGADDGSYEYKWQILITEAAATWADISDANSSEFLLSYASVKEMLNDENNSFIRYGVKKANQDFVYSPMAAVHFFDTQGSDPVQSTNIEDDNLYSPGNTELPSGEEDGQNGSSEKAEEQPSDDSSEDISEYVTVTIKYQFEDGKTAFDSYIASLEKGTDFIRSVQSPMVVGYNPWIMVNGKLESAEAVNLNYSDLQQDKEVVVTYLPKEVNYGVRYYFQNVSNDSYTENLAQHVQAKGLVGTYPDSNYVDRQFDGFEKIEADINAIAADGSTEYQIVYDRCYYLILFDLDGGYGAEPIYAKYGTPFLASTPVKEGYTFAGWDIADENGNYDGVSDIMFQTVPARNLKCKALWAPSESRYTVVYWKQNAQNDNYSYWDSKVVEDVMTESNVSGIDDLDRESTSKVKVEKNDGQKVTQVTLDDCYEKDYFHFKKADENITVKGDGTSVVNVYYDRNKYDIRFYIAKMNRETGTRYISDGTSAGVYTGVFDDAVGAADEEWASFISGTKTDINEDGNNYYYFEINDKKYGEKIADVWPANGPISGIDSITMRNKKYNFVSWSTELGTPYWNYHSQRNIKGAYDTLSADMIKDPYDSLAQSMMAYYNSNAVQYTYEIYFQDADGESYPDKPDLTYNVRSTADGKGQDAYVYQGFTYEKREYGTNANGITASENSKNGGLIRFYYVRESYNIIFMNGGVKEKEEPYKYEALLKDAYYTPDFPDEDMAEAYEFGGWYTSEACAPGSEFDFSNAKMDTENILLYARWVPKIYDVNVYGSYDDLLNNREESESFNYQTRHYTAAYGQTISKDGGISITIPEREGYTFLGWFYINKNGQKEAFDFEQSSVYREVNVFADWRSDKKVKYKISYVDTDGTKIADDFEGTSFAGITMTFSAKTGTGLYKEYREGYFPQTNSHSIVMSEQDGEDVNCYEFIYEKKESVSYTVRYIDAKTGMPVVDGSGNKAADKVVDNNKKAVVTEKFKYIEGYIPDAFYKQLTISTDDEQNTIIFYYTKEVEHARYVVNHLVQNIDDNGYTEYLSEEGIGEIGETVEVNPIEIEGFTFNSRKTNGIFGSYKTSVTVEITAEGLEINLYYDRNNYDYTVRYLEYGTNKEIIPTDGGSSRFGSVIAVTAEDSITDSEKTVYNLVSDSRKEVTITSNAEMNVFTFYYTREKVTIQYKEIVVRGTSSECTVSLTQEIPETGSSVLGSYPIIKNSNYEFVGWYMDEECTIGVDEKIISSDDSKRKNMIKPEYKTAVYYAKFVPKLGSLVINSSGSEGIDENQSYIYRISGIDSTSSAGIDLEVTIHGNSSAVINNLPVGEYTVTVEGNWSWRYSPENMIKKISVTTDGSTISFYNERKQSKWLDGNASFKDNHFN